VQNGNSGVSERLLGCPDCDLVLEASHVDSHHIATCPRCGALLFKGRGHRLDRAVALQLAALILFIVANAFPFITFRMEGLEQLSHLTTGIIEFYKRGLWPLSVVVALATICFPLVKILGSLYVLLPLRRGRVLPGAAGVFRAVETLRPWAMMEVFLLGVIVAYVKLVDFATLDLGPALFAFAGLIVIVTAADAVIEPREVWNGLGPPSGPAGPAPEMASARRATGHSLCHTCHYLHLSALPPHSCPRCGAALHRRKPNSLTRCLALVATAAVLYIPANVFPVMTVVSFGKGEADTIMSGVKAFIAADMWPLALLVFFASVTVPVLKLVGLTYLILSVKFGWHWRPRDRTKLYRVVDMVGRWSMIDVFMVSILIALVKLGNLATIEPGIGVTSFAGVVVITMIASHAFDPRLIWDQLEENNG